MDNLESLIEDLPDAVQEDLQGRVDGVETMERRRVADEVRRAVLMLPERQRAAVTLCHFEGFTNIETADILETTVEAVESLLTRGRRKLRELLRDEAASPHGERRAAP